MEIEEYLKDRVEEQIAWYDKKSMQAQKTYKVLQTTKIILASTIPLLAGYSQVKYISILIGIFGAAIAVIESVAKLNKYHENWIYYRTTCESLIRQKYLFITGSSPYNKKDERIANLFIENIEAILSSENRNWEAYHQKADEMEAHAGS